MHPWDRSIYLKEMALQCHFALAAIRQMNAALTRPEPQPLHGEPSTKVDSNEFFRAAHDFVGHAAIVSRFLWPSVEKDKVKNQRAKARAEELCNYLKIQNHHVLRDRKLRNHLEHFDIRLDDWMDTSETHNWATFIGPINMYGGNAISAADVFRHFDPNTKRMIFRGESFDFQAIATGIEDILRKVADGLSRLDQELRDAPDPV